MVGGGGSRRDEASFAINNSNVFAALETLRKKKSDKDKASRSSSKVTSKTVLKDPEPAPVFWAPTPRNNKSWADVDDDDDDDYYVTAEPLQSAWAEAPQSKEQYSIVDEDTVSEEDLLDEDDEDIEEKHDHEMEVPVLPEPVAQKPAGTSMATKETERQLSKKERKKKELAELEALLADFAVKDNDQDESGGKKEELNGEVEKKDIVPGESKNAKKKKKKSTSKEAKEHVPSGPNAETSAEPVEEEDVTSSIDVKDRLKKMASVKKKKSSKEMDVAARAASQEAAARSAKLAAAKRKEKNHYHQQPLR
ncbi:hypothetical protein SAY87_030592 [Trapa incisa]|uniref:Uncharacterized protein n=1 Tax=Trapa incisa TaxID=236973 RepID=A0AAN7QNE8_9MYRT|nr:hypothetical protein SAY87_030592 [Trapa incisa]